MAEEPKVRQEEYKVSGAGVVEKVKDLVHQGNIRRVVIKQDEETILELPLTLAVVGALLAPQLAALGALAALVTDCSIVVERIVED